MQKVYLSGILLLLGITVMAQTGQVPSGPAPMKPEMTEFYEPEVRVVQPATILGMAPSDAIILFDGNEINREWGDSEGEPTG